MTSPSSPKNWDDHVSEIIPGLFLGDVQPSLSEEWLKENKITHIVNAASELKNNFPDTIKYYNANLEDSRNEALLKRAVCGVLFIELAMKTGGRVLVHCYLGRSRSASIVIYYLMAKLKIPYEKAFYMAKKLRHQVGPNSGYELQLRYHTGDYADEL